MADSPDLDEIRAALAAATPAPWLYGQIPNDDHPDKVEYLVGLIEKSDQGAELYVVFRLVDDPDVSHEVMAVTGDGPMSATNAQLLANAPTWLAALVQEVERLQAEKLRTCDSLYAALADLGTANKRGDAWREDSVKQTDALLDAVAERDAALAEWSASEAVLEQVRAERDAWRASADQLAACLRRSLYEVGSVGALAEYERLKGAKS